MHMGTRPAPVRDPVRRDARVLHPVEPLQRPVQPPAPLARADQRAAGRGRAGLRRAGAPGTGSTGSTPRRAGAAPVRDGVRSALGVVLGGLQHLCKHGFRFLPSARCAARSYQGRVCDGVGLRAGPPRGLAAPLPAAVRGWRRMAHARRAPPDQRPGVLRSSIAQRSGTGAARTLTPGVSRIVVNTSSAFCLRARAPVWHRGSAGWSRGAGARGGPRTRTLCARTAVSTPCSTARAARTWLTQSPASPPRCPSARAQRRRAGCLRPPRRCRRRRAARPALCAGCGARRPARTWAPATSGPRPRRWPSACC